MTPAEMTKVMQKYWGIIRVPHDKRAKEFLKLCQSDVVELNSNSYKYYRQGDGPTVVLVHGLYSNLGSMVPIAQDLVAQGFGVVLFDAPAHGEAVGTSTDPIEVRELIRKIGQRLGEIRAVICHSLGGVWALCAWSNEFCAGTLVSIAAPSTHKFLVEKFVQLNRLSNEVAEAIVNELETRFGKTVWIDLSPAEIVKTLAVPGLIIHGKNDDFVPPAHAEQLHSNWSKARVEMLEGVGHFDVVGSSKARDLVAGYLRDFSQGRNLQ